jgi:hypothetical protein
LEFDNPNQNKLFGEDMEIETGVVDNSEITDPFAQAESEVIIDAEVEEITEQAHDEVVGE